MKPITTEKAVRLIELDNTLMFEVPRTSDKKTIKKDIEDHFDVKVASINTFIRLNKKYVYAKLQHKYPAIDIATKLGIM